MVRFLSTLVFDTSQPLELRPCLVICPVGDVLVLHPEILPEVIGAAVHGESASGEQLTGHDRGIRVTKVCHHTGLSVQLI